MKKTLKISLNIVCLILVSLGIFITRSAQAQNSYYFEGIVSDTSTYPQETKLEGARVRSYTSGDLLKYYTAQSDNLGYYRINDVLAALDETISFSCSHDGYQTQEKKLKISDFPAGFGVVDFQLQPNPLDWTMFRGSISRTGFNYKENKITPPFNFLWAYTEENGKLSSIESSPIIYENKVYAGDFAMECFDLNTGRIIWSHFDGHRYMHKYIWSTPCISDGKLFVANFGNLYCFDANTGIEIWRVFPEDLLDRNFRASPVVVGNTLYIGMLDYMENYIPANKLFAIDTETGRIKCSINIDGGIYGSPAVEGNRIYLAVRNVNQSYVDISIRCYDITEPESMLELWRTNLPADLWDTSTPVIYQDYLYYIASKANINSTLFAFNRYTGDIVLTYDFPEASYITSPAIAYGNIYVACYTKLYCLNLERLNDNNPETSPLVWTFELSQPYLCGINSSPTIANGYIFFGADDMYAAAFYCLDALTGSQVWQFNHNGQGMGYSLSSPAVRDGKVVFVSAHDYPWSGIYCFGQKDATPPATPAVSDEGVFTTKTDQLYASWTSDDKESGIAEYQYKITQDLPILPIIGTVIRDWTSTGTSNYVTAGVLNLIIGKTYYFSVKAKNGAGLWSEVGYSDGITVDTTPPTTPQVTDEGATTTSTTSLSASWSSSDTESGIAEYQYAIGTEKGATDVLDWTSAGTNNYVTAGALNLTIGKIYYFGVQAKNGAELWSEVGYSDGITVASPLKVSTTNVTLTLIKDYSSPSGLTLANAFTITNSSNSVTGWQLYNNQDGTYTPPGGQPTSISVQGFGFYESSGGILAGQTITIRAYVNNNKANGLYKGSYKLQELRNGSTIDVATISYALEVKGDTTPPTTPVVTDEGQYTTKTDQLYVSWSSSDPESGIAEYQYAIGTEKDATDVLGWTSAGTNLSVTVTGLTLQNGKTYYFSVKARNGAGLWSEVGYSDGITVDTTAPTTPQVTDEGATTTSTTSLSASWSSSDAESGIAEYQYQITQDSTSGTVIKSWTSNSSNSVNVTDLSLTNGKAYYFGVKAKNDAGLWSEVGYSDGITVSVSPPQAPSNLTAQAISSTQIKLSWMDNSTNETGFKIERGQGASLFRTYAEVATVVANIISYTDSGLVPGTTYYYRLRAYNAAGNSTYSNTASATVVFPAPTNLVAQAISSTQIKLSWMDNSTEETGFKIERSASAFVSGFTQIATVGVNITTFTDSGLVPGTKYYYRLRAYNAAGNSGYSNTASATVVFPAPTNLLAQAISSTQIKLSWKDNSTEETGFKIERRQGTSLLGTYAQVATVGVNITTFTDSGLVPGTTYYYRLRAYNAAGNSGYSNTASAKTP